MTLCTSSNAEQEKEDIRQVETLSKSIFDDNEKHTLHQLIEVNKELRDEHKKERKIHTVLSKHLRGLRDEIEKIKKQIPEHREEIDFITKECQELEQKKIILDKEAILMQYKLRKAQNKRDHLRMQIAEINEENIELEQQLCDATNGYLTIKSKENN